LSIVDPEFLHHIEALAGELLGLILSPFVQFMFQGSVFYWPNLITNLVVAFLVFALARGGIRASWQAFRERYLSRRIWWHKSAEADYSYYLVNSIFYTAIVAPLVLGGAAVGVRIEHALIRLLGAPQPPQVPLWAVRALYTAVFFVVYDFARFAGHSLLHEVPVLWQFHKVHHSAEVLTPITDYRVHPVEAVIMSVIASLATGVVSGIAWYWAADEIGFFSFLGAHVCVTAFNTIANLRHFHVWVSFGPRLNRWLLSPAHHQIHHSRDRRHFGMNRGNALAVWDRMCGTLYIPGAEEELRLGLGDGTDGAWHGVGRMYGWPFRYALALYGLARPPSVAPALENPEASGHRI
jgi:sterol desaturase/sphingolipid hydroxylase (fatty acid hydroxylase superfamily)